MSDAIIKFDRTKDGIRSITVCLDGILFTTINSGIFDWVIVGDDARQHTAYYANAIGLGAYVFWDYYEPKLDAIVGWQNNSKEKGDMQCS